MPLTLVIFVLIIAAVAVGVYLGVNYGGLRLTKRTLETEEPQLAENVDDDQLDGLPTDARF